MSSKKNRNKKVPAGIKNALAALEKRFGEPVVFKMSDANANVDTFSSGRPNLDVALGGGYGIGKIIEIFSEEACGKTGLALEAIKVIQDDGGIAAIIDAEHALNTEYCEEIGVDIDALYLSQPTYAEQAFEAIRALINSREVDLIVIDSVSSLVPKAVLEGESGEAKIANLARIMSVGMTLIAGPAAEAGCTVMFLNQLRSSIMSYGASKKPTGGNALKFYASQRLEIKNKGKIKEGSGDNSEIIGFKQLIKVVKNKIGRPFKEVQDDIIYGVGIDSLNSLVEALVYEEILEKAGSWFKYEGTNIAQGIKKLRVILEDNPELYEELEQKLEEKKNK